MSDDKAQQEPSMEDILASIRRILSEDDAEEAVKAPPQPAPVKAAPPPPPEPEPEPEPEPLFEMEPEPEPGPVFEMEPEPMAMEEEEDILELTDDMVAEDDEPAPEPEPEPESFLDEEPAPRLAPIETEDSILSPPTQAASASSFAELARAVARDRGLGLGNGGLTIEDIVREILKGLIKDWLDENLPYMIERIVKKEIEKMVNRAERL
jgi:hypothetical protein